MKRLSDQELTEALAAGSSWELRDGVLVREWTFSDFPAAILFVQSVAELAEAANHHPDIDIRYNHVKLALVTHDAGGITQKDLDMSRAIDVAFP